MIQTRNNEIKVQNFFYALLLLIQPLITIALVFEHEALERLLMYLIYVSALAIFLVRFLKNKVKRTDWFLLAFFVLFVFKMLFFKDGSKALISFVAFFIMLVAFGASDDIKATTSIKNIIIFSYFIQSIVFCFLSLSEYAYKAYAENTEIADVLTLGIANPNQTGIMLFVNIIVLWWGFKNVEKRTIKLILFVLWAWLIVLLLLTKARTSILALIFVYLFNLIFKKNEHKASNRYGLLKSCFIAIIPLIFLFVYLSLSNTEVLQDITIFGKNLVSGREDVYQNVLDSWQNILLGDIAVFSFSNAHNSYLSILANIGIVGFLLFFVFIINEIYKRLFCQTQKSSILYWAFWSVFLISCTESALLVGGSIYFIMLCTLCFLFKVETNNR